MTPQPEIKGWCPGALRPMASGDGLIVRIRPPGGTLTPAQAAAIARAAMRHGNGILDLSARANLQLRGVTEASHGPLIEALRTEGLIDPDIETESLRNLIITPFRGAPPTPSLPHAGGREPPPPGVSHDTGNPRLPSPPWGGAGGGGHPAIQESLTANLALQPAAARLPPPYVGEGRGGGATSENTDAIAAILTAALARMPRLPAKFGFAVDTGPHPVLSEASADIRVERAANGQLILRPDGHPLGRPVTDLAADAIALASWFVASGGVTHGRGRMAALVGRGIIPDGCTTAPAAPLPRLAPGLHPEGALLALAFGQLRAETLLALSALGHAIRPTPWRMLLLVGATTLPAIPDLITDPADPILRVTACTGAPGCPQGHGDTRVLARALAAHLPDGQHLHLSGCAKGCAHPGPADLTLTATVTGYDLIRNATASDTPARRGLAPQTIPDLLKATDAPQL